MVLAKDYGDKTVTCHRSLSPIVGTVGIAILNIAGLEQDAKRSVPLHTDVVNSHTS